MERVCNRQIPSTKRECIDPYMRKWFQNFLDQLELHATIEPWKRTSVLREVFPRGIVEQVISLITVFRDYVGDKYSGIDSSNSPDPATSVETIVSPSEQPMPRMSRAATRVSRINKSLFIEHERASKKMFDYITNLKPNPYSDFFKKPELLASIWKQVPSLLLEQMSLRDKSEVISKRIAAQFINWLKDSEMLEGTININSIIEMFSINEPIIVPIKVELQQLHSVPKDVGTSLGLLSRTKKKVLQREIKRDVRATKVKLKPSAFGRTIPEHEQERPLNNKHVQPWLKCANVPKTLESMQSVWQGITHLKSTREYCKFLATKHPNVKPPKYLKDCGLLDLQGIKCHSKQATLSPKVSRITIVSDWNF